MIHGCRCFRMEDMGQVLAEHKIRVAIVAVPADAGTARRRWRLMQAGVTGLLNFAPTHLRVPLSVYVEDMDITTALEKVAYFARHELNV